MKPLPHRHSHPPQKNQYFWSAFGKGAIACLVLTLTLLPSTSHAEVQAAYERSEDPHGFTIFMSEGGWRWYQDPRAILHQDKLYMGSVKGNGDGEALVGIYDLNADKSLGAVVMHAQFDRDDHNSPVFHVRPDGDIMAVYARHNRDLFHYSRVSKPQTPLQWSKESRHKRRMPNPRDRVTYMNLYEMTAEESLYLFFRGVDFNPTFVTSKNHGETWSEPVHFFKNEVGGRHRPYTRYTGNGKDTVYVSVTDAHPRNFGNSIYYFEFRDGQFYRADGSVIKDLVTDGPLRPSEAERVFQGTGSPGRGANLSAIGAAWTSAIEISENGHAHIAYTVYNNNTDHDYRLASWDGNRWIDRQIAHGGKCLYDRESSYTGLIAMDPLDPTVVVISSDVDPTTGEDLGGQHEIYRARIGPNDDIHSV